MADKPPPDELPPIVREVRRIFGVEWELDIDRPWLMLPLVGDDDALAFFRGVPAGTPWGDLMELAETYRAAHPLLPPAVG